MSLFHKLFYLRVYEATSVIAHLPHLVIQGLYFYKCVWRTMYIIHGDCEQYECIILHKTLAEVKYTVFSFFFVFISS